MLLSIALQGFISQSRVLCSFCNSTLFKCFSLGTQGEETPKIVQSPEVDVYCICQKEEFGAMIACDNPQCPVQWFHFACVGITREPTGHWYCDECQLKLGQE